MAIAICCGCSQVLVVVVTTRRMRRTLLGPGDMARADLRLDHLHQLAVLDVLRGSRLGGFRDVHRAATDQRAAGSAGGKFCEGGPN